LVAWRDPDTANASANKLPAVLGIRADHTLAAADHSYDLRHDDPVFLLVAFSWSWLYLPALALALRPNGVRSSGPDRMGPSETPLL